MPERAANGEKVFRGIPVSPGIAQGKVVVYGKTAHSIPEFSLGNDDLAKELQRLQEALVETRHQILAIQRSVSEALGAGDARIFDAHLLVLEDPTLIDEVTRKISSERINAERAFHLVAEKYAATLETIPDDYLRERVTDMRDVASRVLSNLLKKPHNADVLHLGAPCIVLGRDLTPSAAARLDKKFVLGFATDIGSPSSHAAIMARSLGIPGVVSLARASEAVETGDYVLLDGFNGCLIVNPTDQTLFEYGQLIRKQVSLADKFHDILEKPAITLDGLRVTLSANIEQATDTEAVKRTGAEGVGLFRTEGLFLHRNAVATEEEQYQAYRSVAEAVRPHPVLIRTLDLGGDKFVPQLKLPREMNPFLGWRAIRFSLEEKELFRTQLRAVLRASVESNIRLMYPMISSLDELLQANQHLEECKSGLRKEGIPFNEQLEVGVMIEIPSAVLIAESLAKRVKFFSIGTNDLIQYSLAVDRLNERIAHLYQPTHPAILNLIRLTVEAAHRNGIWAGVCGEMAGDPVMVPLLIGLGVDELSASPPSVPPVKYLLRRLKSAEAKALADWAVGCESASEILGRSRALTQEIAPSLFGSG